MCHGDHVTIVSTNVTPPCRCPTPCPNATTDGCRYPESDYCDCKTGVGGVHALYRGMLTVCHVIKWELAVCHGHGTTAIDRCTVCSTPVVCGAAVCRCRFERRQVLMRGLHPTPILFFARSRTHRRTRLTGWDGPRCDKWSESLSRTE